MAQQQPSVATSVSSEHISSTISLPTTHHLFSKIPHYYGREATHIIKPLLGKQYHGDGAFLWSESKLAFTRCQYVEEDARKDPDYFLSSIEKDVEGPSTMSYRGGCSPKPGR